MSACRLTSRTRSVFLRFVRYLERRDAADSSEMSQVLEKLVHRFQSTERYANDIRYVKYCITYVSLRATGLSSVRCGAV